MACGRVLIRLIPVVLFSVLFFPIHPHAFAGTDRPGTTTLDCNGANVFRPSQTIRQSPLVVTRLSCARETDDTLHLLIHVKVLPETSGSLPDHYHIYIDGKMVAMISIIGHRRTIGISPIRPGIHHVWIIAADMLTHKLLGGSTSTSRSNMAGQMGGMDMSMDSMKEMPMDKNRSTLSRIPAHAMVTSFDIRVH